MIIKFSFALLLGILFSTPAQNTITFQVDIKEAIVKNIFSYPDDKIIVRGNFEGWNTDDYALNDDDTDSIFSEKFILRGDSESVIEYKFVILKRTGEIIWEYFPNPDNPPYGNRKLTLTGNPQLLPIEKFQINSEIDLSTNGRKIVRH